MKLLVMSRNIQMTLAILICIFSVHANAQIKYIASFNHKSPSSEDLFFANEIKNFIENKYQISVQLINEPELYDGNYIYITPSYTWTRWNEADFWGNPQLKIKYERIKLEVTYFSEEGSPVTDRYFIGSLNVKKNRGEIIKALRDFNFKFPK